MQLLKREHELIFARTHTHTPQHPTLTFRGGLSCSVVIGQEIERACEGGGRVMVRVSREVILHLFLSNHTPLFIQSLS